MTKRVVKGKAFNIAPGMVLFKGKNPNKTDDIDVGPNNPEQGISVNNNEIGKGFIASKDGKSVTPISNTIQILSNQPMLGGVSPTQLLYGGMPFNEAFAMQEQYKDIHGINDDGSKQYAKHGGIYIKPSKQGTFTVAAKQHGMNVQGFASKVLANKENYSPAMVKKANFARNASKWNHLYGGEDILINSLGERPNAKFEKDMKNKRNKAVYGDNITAITPVNIGTKPFIDKYGTIINPNGSIASIKIPEIGLSGSKPVFTTTTPKSSGLSALGADLIGAGINTVGSLIAAGINQNAINKQTFTPRKAVLLNPVKLKTKININPQITKMREMQAQLADAARRTSGSSRTAYQKILAGHNRLLESAMDLYGNKENTETELINRDRINQQNVANQNAQNVINTVNTNIAGRDDLNNRKSMLTAQNWINPINVTAGTIAGPQGLLARRDARRNNAANLAMMSLAYPDAARMIMSGDGWQKAFNGYYNMLNNKVGV